MLDVEIYETLVDQLAFEIYFTMSEEQFILQQLLDYEVLASPLSGWISFQWMRDIMAKYYLWKVKKKLGRYQKFHRKLERNNNGASRAPARRRFKTGRSISI